jgi:hypothetical protein
MMDRFQSISKYKVEYLEFRDYNTMPCSQYISVGLRNLVRKDGEDGPSILTPLIPATCGIQLLLLQPSVHSGMCRHGGNAHVIDFSKEL